MLISTDLVPLKRLTQEHPTTKVVGLCQQLQLTPYVYLVNVRLSTIGTLNKQVAELAEIYLPLPQSIWNTLAAASESVPCSFNTALVDEQTSLASGISEEEGTVYFEPVLQIDLVSLAPLQLSKFSKLQLDQTLANFSESSETLHRCLQAMVAKGWVTYSPNLHKWEWHVTNDYTKAVADLIYRKGLIDSKQSFISVCISQSGTLLNPKSTTITEANNVQKLVMDLLNPILSA